MKKAPVCKTGRQGRDEESAGLQNRPTAAAASITVRAVGVTPNSSQELVPTLQR
jgi:hypothetical protein